MSSEEFSLTVRHSPDLSILDLKGEINASAQAALAAGYDEAERAQAKVVLLNFKDVAYINSTGIALIVSLARKVTGGRSPAFGLRTERPLRRDFQHHSIGGLYVRVPGRIRGSQGAGCHTDCIYIGGKYESGADLERPA